MDCVLVSTPQPAGTFESIPSVCGTGGAYLGEPFRTFRFWKRFPPFHSAADIVQANLRIHSALLLLAVCKSTTEIVSKKFDRQLRETLRVDQGCTPVHSRSSGSRRSRKTFIRLQ